MNLKGEESCKWPFRCLSMVVDSYMLMALSTAQKWGLNLHVALDSHLSSAAQVM